MKRGIRARPGSVAARLGPQPAGLVTLRELTLQVGDADLYVHLDRHVTDPNGALLFEALLTDAQGSRPIYIDREELAECMLESVILEGSA